MLLDGTDGLIEGCVLCAECKVPPLKGLKFIFPNFKSLNIPHVKKHWKPAAQSTSDSPSKLYR